ncbi:histidine kinase [Sorangium cellulosum]|uniref:histidine kinase n=1 Tax=Sorangium cellulosum TaxID=56 RepID=A0A150TVG6_SORCE|nr:histidine kinase [Sorangium cellulosum]
MAQPTRGGTSEPSTEDGLTLAPPLRGEPGQRTEEERASASLPSAQDLAVALHEVSNALTVIVGCIERAQAGHGAELSRALGVAVSRARDARRLIRRAIGADAEGRPAGDAEVASTPLGEPTRLLADVIDDAVTGLEPEARRSSIALRAEIDPDVARACVSNGAAVVQILTNLLLNAVALSPRGSTVRVDARLDGAAVIVGVADQGPGVPPSRRATLLSSGVSTRPGGAGIGLRHSAALASSAGGALALVPSDEGARFELRWPIEGSAPAHAGGAPGNDGEAGEESGEAETDEAPPAPRSTTSPLPGAVLEGVRILVVEDDDAVVDLLDTALTARGASIVSVQSAVELPGALASGPFQAALLDISPIAQDVLGTVSAVRSANPDVRLVVMSGSAVAAPLPPNSGVSWVRKPFEIREIVEALVR